MIETALPSSVGIPEEAIKRFFLKLEASHVPMHSVLLMRHGKLVTEGYYAPYQKDTLHRMFSICKTLNALAIGILEDDGLLSLDDPIIKYFPEKLPANPHPWIATMTIRNMLMMRTCHASTTFKYNGPTEWVESFFNTPPSHKPGTVFHYDTSAAHVLCKLVERLSGEPMLDFLKKRALREIGWSEESYVLKNEWGDFQGGSGLMCTPMDLLLLGKLLMQEGNWEGKQLLPQKFVKDAVSNLTPNPLTGPVISEMQGYGYQIWRTQHNGFVCYGMGGQLAICLPDYDLICVTTADTQGMGGGNQFIYNSFYEEILPALDTPSAATVSSNYLENLYIQPLSKLTNSVSSNVCEDIKDKTYTFAANPAGFTSFQLRFNGNEGVLTYSYKDKECELEFGLDHCKAGSFPAYGFTCATSGTWIEANTFYIKSHLIDTAIGSVHMEFVFGSNDVVVFMKKIEETMLGEYNGHLYGTT